MRVSPVKCGKDGEAIGLEDGDDNEGFLQDAKTEIGCGSRPRMAKRFAAHGSSPMNEGSMRTGSGRGSGDARKEWEKGRAQCLNLSSSIGFENQSETDAGEKNRGLDPDAGERRRHRRRKKKVVRAPRYSDLRE
ncbi:unnamed protein product [Arabidopsis thaliana]|uniref:(thale cress) hypothetical protein n=1 Tax=Arabidopsis thaliana TaxID=3702 RepID=A0A7G2FIA0_ARATH|nr:unnamed protein product [Arabidopsis thaliana]